MPVVDVGSLEQLPKDKTSINKGKNSFLMGRSKTMLQGPGRRKTSKEAWGECTLDLDQRSPVQR